MCGVALKVRPYCFEDFYALTGLSDKPDAWCAMQFNRPDESDGIVEVFRREDAPLRNCLFYAEGH